MTIAAGERPDILTAVGELSSAAWAYAGLSAAFELGIVRALDEPATAPELGKRLGLDPELVADLLDVLVALGAVELRADGTYVVLPDFEPFRSGSLSRVVRAGVRSDHLQTAEAFRRARDGSLEPGWEHRDPELLIAQGETAGLFRLAAEHVLPSLDGLAERLARPGARFLDVGAGVGVLSRELLLVYPEVSAVCVEPNATARALGQERFLEAGLADRVEFVSHGVEDLGLTEAYDLALMPQPFFSPEAFELGLGNVLRSLRPGGWLVVLTLDLPRADSLTAASRRVRGRLWGGGAVDCERVVERLGAAGFESAHAHPPVGDYRMLAARRTPVAGGRVPSDGQPAGLTDAISGSTCGAPPLS
jgi:SAM-dependent methyltransferase